MHLFVLGYFKTNFILKQKCSKSEINNWKLDIRFLVLCQCDHEGCPLFYLFIFLNASCVKCLRLCWKVQQLIDSQLLYNVEGFKGALLQSGFAKEFMALKHILLTPHLFTSHWCLCKYTAVLTGKSPAMCLLQVNTISCTLFVLFRMEYRLFFFLLAPRIKTPEALHYN